MKPLYLAILLFSILASPCYANSSSLNECTDEQETVDLWREIRTNAKHVDANKHALALLPCLASPNPELRDNIAYEVLTYWIREDKLDAKIIYEMKERLLPWLGRGAGDAAGNSSFARAFAALILAELVREDRRNTRWRGGDVDELVNLSTQMLRSERDYRGLDPKYGWIHTIAHGSDLLWRLSRHPKILVEQQSEILDAIAIQLSNPDTPAFVFNESDRLARPVASVFTNPAVASKTKNDWIEQLASPHPWDTWNTAFASSQGMARLHNVKQFLRALKEALLEYDDGEIKESIDESLASLP